MSFDRRLLLNIDLQEGATTEDALHLVNTDLSERQAQSNRSIGRVSLLLSLSDALLGFDCAIQFDSSCIERPLVERMIVDLKVLLNEMVRETRERISTLAMLSAFDRDQLVHAFGTTDAALPTGKLIHVLSELQVKRTRDAVAVICDGVSFTYAEINAQARHLARHLVGRRVGPDALVAVCVE